MPNPPQRPGFIDPLSMSNEVQRLRLQLDHTLNYMHSLSARTCALEAHAALVDRGRTPKLELKFRSQFGEDQWLWNLFKDQPDGFFIEVGAFDGRTLSVSWIFEAIGWKGLLIEPIPARYEQCKACRPNSRVVNAAVSKKGSAGTATFEMLESGGDDYVELMSYYKTTAKHYQQTSTAKHIKINVPLSTMNDVLGDIHHAIDFAVIDVEGHEMDLFDGFDLDKYRPRVLVVEDNQEGKDTSIPKLLTKHGYRDFGWLAVNRLFIREDDKALLDKMRDNLPGATKA
jgi:FkbM family methyltransferase